jgi:hypothetical protein
VLHPRCAIVARVNARAGTSRARWSWVELQALGPDLATLCRRAILPHVLVNFIRLRPKTSGS